MKARRLIPLGIVAVAAVVIAAIAALAASGSSDAAPGQGSVRIGLVSDVGRFNDRSFNQSALEGLKKAQRQLGVRGRPVESRQTSDYVPNLA
jgi:basic membrane protein A